MQTFNVGDMVEVLKTGGIIGLHVGDHVTVEEVSGGEIRKIDGIDSVYCYSNNWYKLVKKAEPVNPKPKKMATSIVHFEIGDRVRVSVEEPIYGWGNVNNEDIGIITKVTAGSVYVNFPRQGSWHCSREELELVSKCTTTSYSTTAIKSNKSKPKTMGVIKNAFMSKESKAVSELGLGENSNNLNKEGYEEFLSYMYETDKKGKADFLAKLVETNKERKAKK